MKTKIGSNHNEYSALYTAGDKYFNDKTAILTFFTNPLFQIYYAVEF